MAKVLLGLAGILFCAILFAWLWRRAHIVSFALAWFFLPLGPVLNARWMPAGVFGERYLYAFDRVLLARCLERRAGVER
jgi:hypothetical protein